MKTPSPHTAIIPSPLGPIGLIIENNFLIQLEYVDTPIKHSDNALAQKISAELQHYFEDPTHSFELDFYFAATEFQLRVWQALRDIPCGTTLTYGELAKKLHTGARAIGNACRTNPVPIIIPCHRVVATRHIGGYAGNMKGKMLGIKQWLLQHEGAIGKH